MRLACERRFDDMLLNHGYPDSYIRQSGSLYSTNTLRPRSADIMYLKFPFISDVVNGKMKRIFRSEGFNIRLAQKSVSLRGALQRRRTTPPCRMHGCTVNSPICLRRNVVYELSCPTCSATYIGSTIRALHVRIKEHLSRPESSVFQHLQQCGPASPPVHPRVLATDFDSANLRLREAFLIRTLKPRLNSRAESEELSDFLFL